MTPGLEALFCPECGAPIAYEDDRLVWHQDIGNDYCPVLATVSEHGS